MRPHRMLCALCVLAAGCGRINFDDLDEGSETPGDGGTATSGTRFYPYELAAPIVVASDPLWTPPCSAHAFRLLDVVPSGQPLVNVAGCVGTGIDDDELFRTYMTAPIRAQVLGGAGLLISGSFSVREGDAGMNARAQLIVKVVSGDGATVRGLLLGPDNGALAYEFNASPTPYRRSFPRGGPAATASVAAQDGDRIVFEIGYHIHSQDTDHRGFFELGGDAAIDLPVSGSSTGYNPWFELGQVVAF